MRFIVWLLLLAGALAMVGNSPAPAADRSQAGGQDEWRYVYHNNEWWYWLPQGRWLFWRDGRWNRYDPEPFCGCPEPYGGEGAWFGPAYGWQPWYGGGPFCGGYDWYGGYESDIGPFYGRAFPRELFGW